MGVIRLSRIKNVYGIDNTHSQVIARGVDFHLYPVGIHGNVKRGQYISISGIAFSVLLGIRTVSGHLGFVDIMYAIRRVCKLKPLRFYMVSFSSLVLFFTFLHSRLLTSFVSHSPPSVKGWRAKHVLKYVSRWVLCSLALLHLLD